MNIHIRTGNLFQLKKPVLENIMGEMIEYFAEKGHHTRLLTTLPYYPG